MEVVWEGLRPVQRELTFKQQSIAALAWFASAAVCLSAVAFGGATTLVWWPNGILVGTLYLLPMRKWPGFLALAAALGIANSWFFGSSVLGGVAIILSNLGEAMIAAGLGQWILRGKHHRMLTMNDLVALVGAAAVSAAFGALGTSQFVPDVIVWSGFLWWFLLTMLGTVIVSPLYVLIVDYLLGGARNIQGVFPPRRGLIEMAQVALVMFLLSLAVLREPELPLLFLPMAVTVFATTRYAHNGATISVLAFSFAAMTVSFGGSAPAVIGSLNPHSALIVLQVFMIVQIITSVPLAALLMSHDKLAARLEARNARMRENLTWLGMAEEVARIGRWRYDPKTGVQNWSRQMFLINGLDCDKGSDPGNIRHMLPDGGKELFGLLEHHSKDRARYTFEYRICLPKGDERILKMHATNEFGPDGEIESMFGVVMDVTEHHLRQEALDKERTRAMRLAAEAQYLAQTDPLTGLANRRRTMTQLEKCIDRCEAEDRKLALIAFDIDHFKQVNDNHGHQVGDDVLIRVAELARGEVRASDLIGRTGGEEFVWMLPDAGSEETANAAERLRKAIEEGSAAKGLPRVTASIGYAVWQPGDNASALLGKADAALYEAKESGRNKVQKAA